MTQNLSTPTRKIEPDRTAPGAPAAGEHFSGVERQLGSAVGIDAQVLRAPAEGERDAILASLYEERRQLTRAKRLGELKPGDVEYLAELSAYIDQIEVSESRPVALDVVWQKLDALAASMLSVQAKLERNQK